MKIILVRHGKTTYWDTNIDEPNLKDKILTNEWINEISKLWNRLSSWNIDLIYSSDMIRTKQTTWEIVKHVKWIPIKYSKLIRERALWTKIKSRSEINRDELPAKLPDWVESTEHVIDRIKEFLQLIENNYKWKNILIVSHQWLLKSLTSFLYKIPSTEIDIIWNLDHWSISVFSKHKNQYILEMWNSTTHLKN